MSSPKFLWEQIGKLLKLYSFHWSPDDISPSSMVTSIGNALTGYWHRALFDQEKGKEWLTG